MCERETSVLLRLHLDRESLVWKLDPNLLTVSFSLILNVRKVLGKNKLYLSCKYIWVQYNVLYPNSMKMKGGCDPTISPPTLIYFAGTLSQSKVKCNGLVVPLYECNGLVISLYDE